MSVTALTASPQREQQGASARFLLKGGTVLSMDPMVGNFKNADVLIEGSKIAAVQPDRKSVV